MRFHDTIIVWFRKDLRLHDHPALFTALTRGKRVIGLYIKEPDQTNPHRSAQDWWLHYALLDLDRSLRKIGVPLIIRKGPADAILSDIAKQSQSQHIYWSRRYLPDEMKQDRAIKTRLQLHGLTIRSFKTSCLFEPWELSPDQETRTGFSPPSLASARFATYTDYKNCLERFADHISKPLPSPLPQNRAVYLSLEEEIQQGIIETLSLDDLDLRPILPDWACHFDDVWQVREDHVLSMLYAIKSKDLESPYKMDQFLPYIRFGQISPRLVWHHLHHISSQPNLEALTLHEFCWHFSYKDGLDLHLAHQVIQKRPQLYHASDLSEAMTNIFNSMLDHIWQHGWLEIDAIEALWPHFARSPFSISAILSNLLLYADPALIHYLEGRSKANTHAGGMTNGLDIHTSLAKNRGIQ